MQRLEHREITQTEGFQPQTGRERQWTVDSFWQIDSPQQPEQEQPGTSQQNYNPMEEGEIGAGTDQHHRFSKSRKRFGRSTWASKASNTKMGHAPCVNAEESINWDIGNA